jgi:hypothetical protein
VAGQQASPGQWRSVEHPSAAKVTESLALQAAQIRRRAWLVNVAYAFSLGASALVLAILAYTWRAAIGHGLDVMFDFLPAAKESSHQDRGSAIPPLRARPLDPRPRLPS